MFIKKTDNGKRGERRQARLAWLVGVSTVFSFFTSMLSITADLLQVHDSLTPEVCACSLHVESSSALPRWGHVISPGE